MLKRDQCWRCDTICSPPSTKIPCTGCGIAFYCSNVCKHSDEFRHQVDCETAALKRKCAGCEKEKNRTEALWLLSKRVVLQQRMSKDLLEDTQDRLPSDKRKNRRVVTPVEVGLRLKRIDDSGSRFGKTLLLEKRASRRSDQPAFERRCPVQQAFIYSCLRRW